MKKNPTPAEIGKRATRLVGGTKAGERLTREERVAKGERDFDWFCRYYLADYFDSVPADFHHELGELVGLYDRVVCSAPRGHAKSTIVSFASPLHKVLYRQTMLCVIVRATDTDARMSVDAIREELEANDRIIEDFGDQIGGRKWTESEFVTKSGVKLLGKGALAKLRGLKNRNNRPDLIIVDDLEDDESVTSPTQRVKLENWFRRVVLGLGKNNGTFRVFVVGTPLHSQALLVKLLKQTDVWTVRRWKATHDGQLNDDSKPVWSVVTIDYLRKKKAEIGSRAFNSEYMDSPASEEEQIFLGEYETRYEERDIAGMKMIYAGAIDPAIGLKAKNDDTATVVVGLYNGAYYLRYARIKKLRKSQQIEGVVSACQRFPSLVAFVVEAIAYQDALRQDLLDVSRERNLQLPIKKATDTGSDKLVRISRLQGLWEQRLIRVPKAGTADWSPDIEVLLEELYDLGVSTNGKDDGPDALERVIEALRGRTMSTGKVGWV